jgi:predicted ArsR family transcriptional regulator
LDGHVNAEQDVRLDRVAALGEPVRRALYRYVAGQPEPVGRDRAASAVDVPHHVAKHHLDRLVADGLLGAEYRRPPGRGGPGAGRPAKVYRAVGDIDVSVPERHYDLAGRLLVRAVASAAHTGAPVADTVVDVAHAAGRELGQGTAATGRQRAQRLTAALESCGFEPAKTGADITLRNCPFHRLAEEDRDLICTMNLAFVRGCIDGSGVDATATLDPLPGGCCVRISPRSRRP